jgi:predicted Rossmann-fold nucleotide-binding protein
LSQTHKLARQIPVVLYGTAYWKEVINFDALVRHGTISAEDLSLFEFADDPMTALGMLQAGIASAGDEPEQDKPAVAHSRTATE